MNSKKRSLLFALKLCFTPLFQIIIDILIIPLHHLHIYNYTYSLLIYNNVYDFISKC